MSTFVLVMFWVYLFCAVVALFNLVGGHPRNVEPRDVGFDCADLIISLALTAWAAYLKWGTWGTT